MQYERLITGVAAVFAALAATLTVVGILRSPAVLFLAAMFAASAYLMYYHASGRMAASLYQRVERQAAQNNGAGRESGFGAGPRAEWEPPRDGRRRRSADRDYERGRAGERRRRRTRQRRQQSNELTPAEAYDRLGLEPSADESAVKRAYREKVKQVHPDTDSGGEREFKRVQAAYETLTDD